MKKNGLQIILSMLLGVVLFISCEKEPSTISVTGITLDETEISMSLNSAEEIVLEATVVPEDATNKNIVWATSDATKVEVKDGKLTLKSEGEATITVTTEDGNKTATCVVIVTKALYPAKTITITEITEPLKKDETVTLEYTIDPENTTDELEWSVTQTGDIISFNEETLEITANNPGEAIITVKSKENESVTASITITVREPIARQLQIVRDGIPVNPPFSEEYPIDIYLNEQDQVMFKILNYTEGAEFAVVPATYSFGDSSIASLIFEEGAYYITGNALGSTTLTFTDDEGNSTVATVNVTEKPNDTHLTVYIQDPDNELDNVIGVDKVGDSHLILRVAFNDSSVSVQASNFSCSPEGAVTFTQNGPMINAHAAAEANPCIVTVKAMVDGIEREGTLELIIEPRDSDLPTNFEIKVDDATTPVGSLASGSSGKFGVLSITPGTLEVKTVEYTAITGISISPDGSFTVTGGAGSPAIFYVTVNGYQKQYMLIIG